MAAKTDFVFDRASKRWRKAGKWARAPKRSQLRSNARGEPIDATGKRVPLGSYVPDRVKKVAKKKKAVKKAAKKKAVSRARPKKVAPKKAPPKKKAPSRARPKKAAPKKKPAKKKAVKRATPKRKRLIPAEPEPTVYVAAEDEYQIVTPPEEPRGTRIRAFTWPTEAPGGVEFVSDIGALSSHPFMSSSFVNRRPPDLLDEVFHNLVSRKSHKQTHLDPDDIVIYRHGLELVNTGGRGTIEDLARVVSRLHHEHPEFTFKYGDGSVHVFIGEENEPLLRSDVVASLASHRRALVSIYYELEALWDGDIGWFVFAENDELEGGS